VTKRFDSPLSFHSLASAVEFLCVNNLLRLMHPCVSGPPALLMLFKPISCIRAISSVIAAIFAEKDVNIVRHLSRTPLPMKSSNTYYGLCEAVKKNCYCYADAIITAAGGSSFSKLSVEMDQ
jgi:hypothetical protein